MPAVFCAFQAPGFLGSEFPPPRSCPRRHWTYLWPFWLIIECVAHALLVCFLQYFCSSSSSPESTHCCLKRDSKIPRLKLYPLFPTASWLAKVLPSTTHSPNASPSLVNFPGLQPSPTVAETQGLNNWPIILPANETLSSVCGPPHPALFLGRLL